MPSAAGKRVGRVLAGCSQPEAGDKPGAPLAGIGYRSLLQPTYLAQPEVTLEHVMQSTSWHDIDIYCTHTFRNAFTFLKVTTFEFINSQFHVYQRYPGSSSEGSFLAPEITFDVFFWQGGLET